MDVLAADLQILTRIEDGRIVNKGLTDTSGHAKTKIGIDVDLADSAACSLTKLIFRNTNGILQSTAVCVDDLDILLRDRGSSVQDDREARQSLDNLIEDIKTKLRLCARLELVCAMAGSDCDCKGINTGLADKFLNVVRIGVGGILRLDSDSIP